MSQTDDQPQNCPQSPLDGQPTPRLNLMGMTQAQAATHLATMGEPAYRAHQITNWMYRNQVFEFGAMTNMKNELRQRLAKRFTISIDKPRAVQPSADGTKKLLFERNGDLWESVLMGDGTRRTVCVSTQSGVCAGMPFLRHRQAWLAAQPDPR